MSRMRNSHSSPNEGCIRMRYANRRYEPGGTLAQYSMAVGAACYSLIGTTAVLRGN